MVGPSGGEHRYVYLQTHTSWSFRQMNSSFSSSRCLALWCPQCTQPSVFNSAHLPLVITNPNSHVFSMRTFRLTKVSQSFPRGRSKNAMVINFLRFFFLHLFLGNVGTPRGFGWFFYLGRGRTSQSSCPMINVLDVLYAYIYKYIIILTTAYMYYGCEWIDPLL